MTALREIHFRDRRAPHEIQFVLERELMTLFQPVPEEAQLTLAAATKIHGVPLRVRIVFEAALAFTNCYRLQFAAAATELSPTPPTGPRKALDGWVDLWTREFKPAPAPAPRDGSAERYRELADRALTAEAHLQSVPAVQQEILNSLRAGASFSTAHKEGGTNIRFDRGRFVRADYGESARVDEYRDEAAFLDFLRKFYDGETSRNIYPEKASEFTAWKLMLRLLVPRSAPPVFASASAAAPLLVPTLTSYKTSLALIVLGIAAVIAVVFGSRLFKVRTIGRPAGEFIRTKHHFVALIETVEPYIPSLHRNPDREQLRFDLLLQPVDGKSPKRLIPVARRLQKLQYQIRMLGEDGDLVWFVGHEIMAFNFKANQLVTASELRRLNPSLGDLIDNGYYEFDEHLRVSSRDQQRVYEFDPATLQAFPVSKPRPGKWSGLTQRTEDWLCAGGRVSPTEWFGVHSVAEVQRDFTPRSSLAKDHSVEPSRQLRQLYRGRLQVNDGYTEIVSMAVLAPGEFVGAAVMRDSRYGAPLRLSAPDGFLVTCDSRAGLGATLIVMRVDLNGQIVWRADTGIGALEQILPDARMIGLVGNQVAAPGKIAEPVLVIVNGETGTVTTHSLWQRW